MRVGTRGPGRSGGRASVASAWSATAATAATFLAWGSSGERSRSSYQLVDVAERAGIVPDAWQPAAPVWYAVPALCGIVLLAASARRDRLVGLTATTLGAIVIAGGALVARSPLVNEPGLYLAVLGGTGAAVTGATTLITTRGWER